MVRPIHGSDTMSNSARAKKPCCPGALTFAAREAATCRSCLVVLETFFRDADTDRAPSIRVRSGQLISSFGHAKVGGLWISEQVSALISENPGLL